MKIAEGGEDGLIQKARLVDWGKEPELLKHGDQGVDPFSFLYSLAQRNTTNQRPKIYPSVTKSFGLESPLPDLGNGGLLHLPHSAPTRLLACFNDSSNFSPKLLWKLFRQVVEHEPQVDPTTFREVLGDQICRTREADSHAVSHQSRLLRTRGCAATRPSEQGDGPKRL